MTPRRRTVTAREIVGKRIVAFRANSYVAGSNPQMRWTMHQPEIELEDGSVLVFLTEEHPDAEDYGVWVGRRMPAGARR